MTEPRALLEPFDATTGGSSDAPDKTTDTPAKKKIRISGQAKTDAVAEELMKLVSKDASQLTEAALKRHTAAIT